ncbi:MAG TPA: hypothetical protein VFS27_06550 [Blastocatellia bacterium]|jgi:hypothetical protein|nr:hypothetical protein [Blastocatellia bacterium]
MSKERQDCIVERDGKLYVRISYTDFLGKRRELMRRATDKKRAGELKKQLVKQLDSAEPGDQRAELGARKLTFAKAADRYEAVKLIPAQYVGDRRAYGTAQQRRPALPPNRH